VHAIRSRVSGLVASGQVREAYELVRDLGGSITLPTAAASNLCRELSLRGHWIEALELATELEARAPTPFATERTASLRATTALLRDGAIPPLARLAPMATPLRHRVLHVVGGHDAEEGQPGRVALSLEELHLERRAGLEPTVVTEMGFGAAAGYTTDQVGGIAHRRLPGSRRDPVGLASWFAAHTTKLANVVQQVRPAVLVSHGDLLTMLAASTVARHYGLLVVLDERLPPEPDWAPVPEEWKARGGVARLEAEADAVIGAGHLSGSSVDAHEVAGVLPVGTSELATLRALPGDLERLRHEWESHPPRDLESVVLRPRRQSPDEILESGWAMAKMEPVRLLHPVPWRELCRGNRSDRFTLHGWGFMDPWLADYAESSDPRRLSWCLDLAVSWCREFNEPHHTDEEAMAWYDMSLALRAPKLAYLLQEALRQQVDDDELAVLHAGVVRHQQELFRPSAFAGHNNHGFYTAVGQLSMSRRLSPLPAMHLLQAQGRARLDTVVRTQFAADGGHREHSPDYHRMLLDGFCAAVDDGLIDKPELAERLARAQDVMGWFVQPDRTLVQIGDSPQRGVAVGWPSTRSAHTAFIASRGQRGTPDTRTMLVLPESGYGFVRCPQPTGREDHERACYLSLMAGFHSRAHKHADDLSVTWFDAGQEVLVDAGRFGFLDLLPKDSPQRLEGFFYSRPERQYVESTRAHCTVEADGRDHDRRDRTPYGSALIDGWRTDDRHVLVGAVDHGHWTHVRRVVVQPGRWLWVRDEVDTSDGDEHDFAVWWQLASAWEVTSRTETRIGFRSTSDESKLWVTSVDAATIDGPVSGAEEPLRGWRSRVDQELTPCWSLALRARARRRVFDTLFTLGDRPLDALPEHPPTWDRPVSRDARRAPSPPAWSRTGS